MENENTKKLDNITKKEILEYIWSALNKANTKGVYTINEAFTLKLLYDKLLKEI